MSRETTYLSLAAPAPDGSIRGERGNRFPAHAHDLKAGNADIEPLTARVREAACYASQRLGGVAFMSAARCVVRCRLARASAGAGRAPDAATARLGTASSCTGILCTTTSSTATRCFVAPRSTASATRSESGEHRRGRQSMALGGALTDAAVEAVPSSLPAGQAVRRPFRRCRWTRRSGRTAFEHRFPTSEEWYAMAAQRGRTSRDGD